MIPARLKQLLVCCKLVWRHCGKQAKREPQGSAICETPQVPLATSRAVSFYNIGN